MDTVRCGICVAAGGRSPAKIGISNHQVGEFVHQHMPTSWVGWIDDVTKSGVRGPGCFQMDGHFIRGRFSEKI